MFYSQTAFQANPDSHNGAIRENYSWSQNYDDVDVKITVPSTISKARQVCFDRQRIGLHSKGCWGFDPQMYCPIF